MEIEIVTIVIATFAFFAAGFVDAIAGGGGLITVPSLMLLNIPPHFALGTNKFACSLGTLAAVWTFFRNKLIMLHLVPYGFISSFLGGVLGSWVALQVESAMLGKIMAFLLPIGLIFSIFSGRALRDDMDIPLNKQKIIVSVIGLIIGSYDGFFGPSTGSFFILALHMFLGLGLVHASGTTKVFNLASNLGALAAFASGGVVLYTLAIPCALGSIIGNQLGARLAIKVGGNMVRYCLYVVLSLLFGSLIYKYFFA